MKNSWRIASILTLAVFVFGTMLVYTDYESSKSNTKYQNLSGISYDRNKTVVDNEYNVTLPNKLNLSRTPRILDGSLRYYFDTKVDRQSYDCSSNDKKGCVPFEPERTYLECRVNYIGDKPLDSLMEEYCVLTNNTNSVTLRTDDRVNDITAPITDADYEVLKGQEFDQGSSIPSDGSEFLSTDVRFENPWDLTFLNKDRYLVTGTDGEINDIKNGEYVEYNIDVLEDGPKEAGIDDDQYTGLLGVVEHPNFSNNNIIYLNYAYEVAEGNTTFSKVSKFRIDREEREIKKLDTIIDSIPGRLYYHGGRMRFGPNDNFLYISTGAADYFEAQNNSYLGGKILRLHPNGSIPENNPYDNPVYAKGLRNPQGMDFHPETGNLYISQHGSWRRDNIAKIEKGTNLGWPDPCNRSHPDGEGGEELLCTQTYTLGPSGITFVDKKGHEWFGDIFVSTLRGDHLHRLDMKSGRAIKNEVFWFNGYKSDPYPNHFNQLRDVEFKNGDLWILHEWGGITRLSTDGRSNTF